MKSAVLLTGGTGSRLLPFTRFLSKHLLNLNGKCIIDYPVQSLKSMGIENLTIVVGSSFSGQIMDYIQDGSQFGLNVNYIYQKSPLGIAQAINLAEKFVDDKFTVMLGDNFFSEPIRIDAQACASIVLANHPDLTKFGVASISDGKIINIEEKPSSINQSLQNFAISGCYTFDKKYFQYFKNLTPSKRGEYEIVDIIKQYLANDELSYSVYNGLWSDAGTHDTISYLNDWFSKP